MTGYAAWQVVRIGNPTQRFIGVVGPLVGQTVAGQTGYARDWGPGGTVVQTHQNQQIVREGTFQIPIRPKFQFHWTREPGKVGRYVEPAVSVVCVIPAHVSVKPRSGCVAEV